MTVTAGLVRMVLKINGFEVYQENVYEHIKNSASQRLRFSFSFKHRSGIKMQCWLRHNLEDHNDSPYNTHRLHLSDGAFSKNWDFRGKDNGPSPKEFNYYMKKFSKALDGFIDLR